uniref:Uncharacterized protein n=1 Tax=Noctiluca scintillans TaxID=2966 RepID=A0A7S1EZK5_NOCSC|mmetsp:Transcript_21209/g.56596  ORF Transcript_21209/g.56596 Transcript_21209/m.56596 type:complete len:466 (+) Transcript_21209:45-1442(+)
MATGGKKAGTSYATVGVVACQEGVCEGYTLFSQARTTYLLDKEGCLMHTWIAKRDIFVSYLRSTGNLIRDGNELELTPQFQAGGAAGYVEEVTWENELVWSWCAQPRFRYLTHHDLELLPNGNVLVLVWEKKSKAQALAAGRHPELVPDDEVWNNLVIELRPDPARHAADEAARWSQWDHLVQDFDDSKSNYVDDVAAHPDKYDINFCPPGGKNACRNGGLSPGQHEASGLAVFGGTGKTGERDWLHANGVAYTEKAGRGFVLLSYNVPSEVVIMEWPPNDGGILHRFGNPLVPRRGDRFDRSLFVQHSPKFVHDDDEQKLRVLLFNNGCAPSRMWSTIDEYVLDLGRGDVELAWSFGPPCGHHGSFYCHHSSGVRRCPDGKNNLVTMGPQGIIFEVTPEGKEVWRFISPIERRSSSPVGVVPQGSQRTTGKFGLFFATRYAPSHCPQFAELCPGPRIESCQPAC